MPSKPKTDTDKPAASKFSLRPKNNILEQTAERPLMIKGNADFVFRSFTPNLPSEGEEFNFMFTFKCELDETYPSTVEEFSFDPGHVLQFGIWMGTKSARSERDFTPERDRKIKEMFNAFATPAEQAEYIEQIGGADNFDLVEFLSDKDGVRFRGKVSIESDKKGEYPDRNGISTFIAKED
jgi:hypothetical protein